MTILLALAGSLAPAGLAYLLIILGQLSKRIGAVIKMPPIYRGQFLAAALVAFAALANVVRAAMAADPTRTPAWMLAPGTYLGLYLAPLALGAGLGLATAWPYWGWLLRER